MNVKKMKINLLNTWRKEYNWLSSDLNFEKFCQRNDIDSLEKILTQYFGEKYFEIITNQNSNLKKSNWIHYLLSQNDLSSLVALFEIGNLLVYSDTLDESIKRKLKSDINDFEGFQNQLFEIYTFRLLDLNNIVNEKKVWKGIQELEGTCFIGDKLFIFECRKAYTADFEKFDVILSIFNQIHSEIQRMKVGRDLMGWV